MVLIYADDNILGVSIHTTKKNTETLVVTDKWTGLEVKAVKTKCMTMSQEQQAGPNHNIQISNKILLKGRTFQISGNNPNKSKLYSRIN